MEVHAVIKKHTLLRLRASVLATNSHTPSLCTNHHRNLAPQVAFGGLDAAVALAEGCVRHCAAELLADASAAEDLAHLWGQHPYGADVAASWTTTVAEPFARMSYTDAVRALSASGVDFRRDVSWGDDLQCVTPFTDWTTVDSGSRTELRTLRSLAARFESKCNMHKFFSVLALHQVERCPSDVQGMRSTLSSH
jgi:hypothetical protein